MPKRIGIFGASSMAMETSDIAHDLGYSVVFVVQNGKEMSILQECGKDTILESDLNRFTDIPYAIGIGEGKTRINIVSRFSRIINFCNLIHPSSTFGRGQRERVDLQQGVIICAGVRFTSNISVGNFTIFNLNASISHDCLISDFVTVSPQSCVLGNVEIKKCAWIGAGTVINQGNDLHKRIIGEYTIIGSGSVVLDNCDAYSTYVGSPARKIKCRLPF